MNSNILSDIGIDLTFYVGFEQKKHFEYEFEIYGNWTLFFIESGLIHYELEGLCRGEAGESDLILCPPNIPFHRSVVNPVTLHLMHFDILYPPDTAFEQDIPNGKIRITHLPRMTADIDAMKRVNPWNSMPNAYVKHYFRDIIYLIFFENEPDYGDATNDPVMRGVDEYIRRNLQAHININKLAADTGYTAVSFIRHFKRVFNATPVEYITQKRLKKAARLLLENDITIVEISRLCGFENPYYFSNRFKQHIGMSPSVYRETFRV